MPQQPYDTPVSDGGAKPFRVALPDSLLADLRERLNRTRWPDEALGSGCSYGTSLPYARELAVYWRDGYDWRAGGEVERLRALHRAPEGHRCALRPRAGRRRRSGALLLLHGWPSSVWEFHKIVRPLTDAGGRCGFGVVVPSLPGYGFSFRPVQDRFGIVECADALSELMTGALGYEEYAMAAEDWGAHIGTRMLSRPLLYIR